MKKVLFLSLIAFSVVSCTPPTKPSIEESYTKQIKESIGSIEKTNIYKSLYASMTTDSVLNSNVTSKDISALVVAVEELGLNTSDNSYYEIQRELVGSYYNLRDFELGISTKKNISISSLSEDLKTISWMIEQHKVSVISDFLQFSDSISNVTGEEPRDVLINTFGKLSDSIGESLYLSEIEQETLNQIK